MIIGDPKYNVKTDRECFENIVKHSSSASALALNLLDNLVPKEVQRISNIKGVFGKAPLDPKIWQLLEVYLCSLHFLIYPALGWSITTIIMNITVSASTLSENSKDGQLCS